MKCTVYDLGVLQELKYVVTFANYRGKWILCRHRERATWETSGGHIEAGEEPLEAARRELYEETGSLTFDIEPVCDYWACTEPHEGEEISWSNGRVFVAKVHTVGTIPESEMEETGLFEEFPENLTYPDITKAIFPQALKKFKREGDESKSDLKISEIMEMQKELQDKHKGKWMALTPDTGRSKLLWMIEELGEVISIIKKRGENAIMTNQKVREAFVEEFVDILMFMNDALMCYGISVSEFSDAFLRKHRINMGRDFEKERASFIRQK